MGMEGRDSEFGGRISILITAVVYKSNKAIAGQ